MCHYDIAYRGPDTLLANSAKESTHSNFQHLPSISENKSESQDFFFDSIILRLYSDEGKNVQETARLKPLKDYFTQCFVFYRLKINVSFGTRAPTAGMTET